MKLLSVNVSLPRTIEVKGRAFSTGIYKEPVAGRVRMRRLNLDGDGQADLENHGGVDKAVYAYPHEHYDHWRRELKRDDFPFGQFGENLTVEGLLEDAVHIGDRFRIGSAVVEVSQPRVPCFKLAHKMGLPQFPKQFLASGRSGFYLRVIEEGEVGAGDGIERTHLDPDRFSVRALLHLVFFDRDNLELARKAVRLPGLSAGWRSDLEEHLKQHADGVSE